MAPHLIAAIDQGTTGTTVLIVDENDRVLGRGYREIPQFFPAPGWVEHDPEAIWRSVLEAFAQARARAVAAAGAPASLDIAAIGITNQRETVVAWDRSSGEPLAPAIVWQDRRTSPQCDTLKNAGHEARVQALTGLVIDPYFSATKIAYLLDHVPGLRARAESGEAAVGTIDSFLVARLSGGTAHVTDTSNAARTQLLDLTSRTFSDELCALFGVPRRCLPEVRPSAGLFAQTRRGARDPDGVIPDGIPITGVAGDQQAALFGQGCVNAGDAKCTFGTGSFLLMNVGAQPVFSRHRLLGTVAWNLPGHDDYALEGGAFICGALVQWLRDGLGIIKSAAEVEALARTVPDTGGVTIVPGFTGLGAPYWRPEARGLISGLSRGTTAAHLARAALEAMALQNVAIATAMAADAGRPLNRLRVDGGATANDLLMQMQADFLGLEIERPAMVEATGLGAARLAAVGAGLRAFPGQPATPDGVAVTRFSPRLGAPERRAALERFAAAAARA